MNAPFRAARGATPAVASATGQPTMRALGRMPGPQNVVSASAPQPRMANGPQLTAAQVAAGQPRAPAVAGAPQAYKYSGPTGMRNPAPQQPSQAQPAGVHVQGQEPLSASALAAAHPNDQKQMLGERLFPLIHEKYPTVAGKVTGMLLEMDNTEILHLLEDRELLHSRVEEAVAVLQMHQNQAKPTGQSQN